MSAFGFAGCSRKQRSDLLRYQDLSRWQKSLEQNLFMDWGLEPSTSRPVMLMKRWRQPYGSIKLPKKNTSQVFKLVLLLLLLPRFLLFEVLFLTWLLKRILLFLLGLELEIFPWMKCEGFVIDMFFVDTWPCNRLQRLTLKLRKDLVGGFKHLVGYPYLGKWMEMNQFDKHTGWNHQPGILFRPLQCLFIGNFLDKAAVCNGEKITVLKLTPSWSVPRTPICSTHLTLWRTEKIDETKPNLWSYRSWTNHAQVDSSSHYVVFDIFQSVVRISLINRLPCGSWIANMEAESLTWFTWKSDPVGKEIPFGKHHDFRFHSFNFGGLSSSCSFFLPGTGSYAQHLWCQAR